MLSDVGAVTRYQIAPAIAGQVPAFEDLPPRTPKIWEGETSRIHLFDAASRVMTRYCGGAREMRSSYTLAVQRLNDGRRRTGTGRRLMLTRGIAALGENAVATISHTVATFDAFDGNNESLRGTRLCHARRAKDGSVTQTKQPPANPGRFNTFNSITSEHLI